MYIYIYIYHRDFQKDETLSWPGWLTYSGRFTHISGHPSAADRAQDREGSPAKDQRSLLCHATNQAITDDKCNYTVSAGGHESFF